MNPDHPQRRWEELAAGDILGNLSPEEWDELETLAEEFDEPAVAGSLEMAAAAIDGATDATDAPPLPPALATKISAGTAGFVKSPAPHDQPSGEAASSKVIRFPHLALAWGVAAALAALLVASFLPERSADPSRALAKLEQGGALLTTMPLAGTDDERFAAGSGRVIWSPEDQEGYMELSGLPANDPTVAQYQLWIVDPTRDDEPVDGGVFDIADSSDSGPAQIIPIHAKLPVDQPAAFVITLEKPGGVVVSTQETVVAVAGL